MTAYDGEIPCDLILSNGWLAEADILVNARRHGLMLTEKDRMIWIGGLIQPGNEKNIDGVEVVTTPMIVDDGVKGQSEKRNALIWEMHPWIMSMLMHPWIMMMQMHPWIMMP